jgi:HB1, ASXL, restriction endonuclease HTH domain
MLSTGVKPLPAGGIFKSAAVEVLRRERRLMSTGEICRLALEWSLLKCSGKTPEATMASSLYGDIKRWDKKSVFVRCDRPAI